MSDGSGDTPFVRRLRAVHEMIKRSSDTQLFDVEAAVFTPVVGQCFDASWGDGDSLPLVLEKVSERSLPKDMPGRKPFALYFIGPSDRVLPQGTYRISHQQVGALDLFMVPLGPGRDRRMTYQAVFG